MYAVVPQEYLGEGSFSGSQIDHSWFYYLYTLTAGPLLESLISIAVFQAVLALFRNEIFSVVVASAALSALHGWSILSIAMFPAFYIFLGSYRIGKSQSGYLLGLALATVSHLVFNILALGFLLADIG